VNALQRHKETRRLVLGPVDPFADEEEDGAAAREGEDGVEEGEGDRIGGVARQIQRDPDPKVGRRLSDQLFGSVTPFHPSLRRLYLEGGFPAGSNDLNRHVRRVEIVERHLKPRAETFTGLVRKGSSLESLAISVDWTPEAFDPFAWCLRTNEQVDGWI
jgi:hypothetical protein